MSKARLTEIGLDVVGTRKNLAVDSIFAWPKSIRTISKSPVPFKMLRAFVRRKDSLPYFLGSSPALAIQNFSRRFMCRTAIGRREPANPAWEKVISTLYSRHGNPFSKCGSCRLGEGASDRRHFAFTCDFDN